ncbi:hypothetical protein F4801DRAFT_441893 [Xylaria longipes]|nr:hypothetical protein F4801DRAFT_441893 [Xylaria longipes]RYC65559.1 hypothetical protein CHU98_g668 [Xylaria longipes]
MKIMQLIRLFALPKLLQQAASLKLNVTAIGARDGLSTLECWQMDQPFDTSTQPGTSGSAQAQLGNVSTLSYSILPSNFDGGLHNAPQNQWVVFLSGLAYITVPGDESTSVFVTGGQFGLIFAADTNDVSKEGHRTQYPGITETIALQIPTADGKVPKHNLVHEGPCSISEIAGLRSFALPA